VSWEAVRRAARAASAAEASAATVEDAIALKQHESAFARAMLEYIAAEIRGRVDSSNGRFGMLRSALLFLEVADGKPMTALELVTRIAGDARPDIFENPEVHTRSLEAFTDARRTIARESDDAEMLN
jgi:hypothetical protein